MLYWLLSVYICTYYRHHRHRYGHIKHIENKVSIVSTEHTLGQYRSPPPFLEMLLLQPLLPLPPLYGSFINASHLASSFVLRLFCNEHDYDYDYDFPRYPQYFDTTYISIKSWTHRKNAAKEPSKPRREPLTTISMHNSGVLMGRACSLSLSPSYDSMCTFCCNRAFKTAPATATQCFLVLCSTAHSSASTAGNLIIMLII